MELVCDGKEKLSVYKLSLEQRIKITGRHNTHGPKVVSKVCVVASSKTMICSCVRVYLRREEDFYVNTIHYFFVQQDRHGYSNTVF